MQQSEIKEMSVILFIYLEKIRYLIILNHPLI